MSVLLLKAALVLTMVFGSVGGTAVLAAESLPDSPLYPIKLTIEETQLALAKNPAQEAALQMAFAQNRAEEIQQMTQKGDIPDEATLQRLQTHWQEALQLAAASPEGAMTTLLVQAQTMVQNQEQAMMNVQMGLGDTAVNRLQQANQILTRTRAAIETGLQDPQTFRHQHGQIPDEMPQPPAPCPDGNCGPRDEMPQPVQPPLGNGYPGPGMGNGECNTPGSCDPMGDENHYGQDPMNGGQNGPGDGDCTDCNPMGDENHYGQDPMNGGQNGPGDCTDCNPMGDQNHNGSGDCMDCNQNYNGQDSGNMNPDANTPPPNNNNWDNNNNTRLYPF